MVCLAAGRESACYTTISILYLSNWDESRHTGDAEEHDLLIRPFLAGIIRLGNAAGSCVGVGDGSPSAVPISGVFRDISEPQLCPAWCLLELDAIREAVADLERCHCIC